MKDLSSLELVGNIRADRDVKASQEELYLRVRQTLLPRIEKRISEKLRSRFDVDDILHDAFLRAMGALNLYEAKSEGQFYAWVYSIAKNLLIDSSRRRSAGNVHFVRGQDEKGPHVSQVVAGRRGAESLLQRSEWIESILASLKKKESEVIRLHKLENRSFQEIADLWGKTPGAVQRFYSRAAQQFRIVAESRRRPSEEM